MRRLIVLKKEETMKRLRRSSVLAVTRIRSCGGILSLVGAALLAVVVPTALAGGDVGVPELVPETAVLLDQAATGTSGNGGNTSSTSTMTNIFSPPTYVDYKRIGTEPVVKVDRYPITTGTYNGKACTETAPCYSDMVYVDSTEGF